MAKYGYFEFEYSGPVYNFDKLIDPKWTARTYAKSERQARNNLAFRYKKEHNKDPKAFITLPGELKEIQKGR